MAIEPLNTPGNVSPGDFLHLAEEAGAHFIQNAADSWSVTDADGTVVARRALSKAEASRLFCEDRGLAEEVR